jgi:hypothetical protein
MADMFQVSRACAFVAGILLPLLQTLRMAWLGGGWGPPREWPIAADAYVMGALLLVGGAVARRKPMALATAWGVCFGILYRSFFEQLADPTRTAGVNLCVLGVKGFLLALATAGAILALPKSVGRLSATQEATR